MRLIGMLDSPYVRRVAICLDNLGVDFEHEALSVFTTFDKFQQINPVVKAPTLLCDDGEVLMDSSLILQYVEAHKTGGETLWSADPKELQHDFRAVGLALAACEKSIQIVYERNIRPTEFQYEPWLKRVTGQLLAAYTGLEQEVQSRRSFFFKTQNHASITSAVAWQFTQSNLASVIQVKAFPGLAELSEQLESTETFLKYPPVGPGVK